MSVANQTPRTWSQLKNIVEYSRKFVYSLNNDVPSSIKFREYINPENGENEYRVYFLAGNLKREITIKYVTVNLSTICKNDTKLIGNTIFSGDYLQGPNDKKLTKEEQLLRERKRCSQSGITQYASNKNRFVFSERSELFFFDDQIPNLENNRPKEITTSLKGAIDVKICPHNQNIISYVLDDNLWIQNLLTKQEIKLTNTIEPLKSGVPSYAVQEEFDRYSGYWWYPNKQINSEDGSVTYRMVYEETDESLVEKTYITPSCTGDAGYDEYRYPRAGTLNSKVLLKMIEFTIPTDTSMPLTIQRKRMSKDFYDLFDWFEYLTRADFTPDGKNFWVEIYDRLQYHTASLLVPLDYFIIDEADTDMQTTTPNIYCLLEQQADTWINSHNSMYFLNETTDQQISFISANEESGFLHLYHYNISLSSENFDKQYSEGVYKSINVEKKQLTTGEWCVDADQSITIDQKNSLMYFHAYMDPTECQFFCVDYKNPCKVRQITDSGFTNHVAIDQRTNLFIVTCSNLKTPSKSYIYQLKNQDQGVDSIKVEFLAQMTGRESLTNDKNEQNQSEIPTELNFSSLLMNNVFNLNMESVLLNPNKDETETSLVQNFFRSPEIFDFMTPDNCKLYGMIYKPFNYVPGEKYRTLLFVYGGPCAQLVTNAYKTNKFSRLNILSLLNYCVVVVDSRGSKNRGLKFESFLKHKMGTVEINDQVMGLEAASKKYDCIDMNRVAIFGWSYGGYMALMGLAQRPDVFKVAISGAPVTTWNLYDTAYTERYMGLPETNKEGYSNGSVINHAKFFPDEENRLLIIHGMIDENVHFAHTRQFIDALIKEGKPYRLQVYPSERHGIRSPDSSIHCDLNLYSFLEQYL